MKNKLAYLDEFGTNSLDFGKPNISTHFIVTAIIIDSASRDKISASLDEVRKRNFQTGEIKSRTVGQDDKRRLKILKEIASTDVGIFSIVVDKRELKSQGLTYKKVFYKFINGLLYQELYRIYPDLQLHADEIGSTEFKMEFAAYVNKQHVPDLFTGSTFSFVKSDSNVLIQTADFVSGTLARCFESTLLSNFREQFLDVLAKRILSIKFWPTNFKSRPTDDSNELGRFDPTIAELGINLTLVCKEKLKSSIEEENHQSICLDHLLFHFQHINPSKYVWRKELMDVIENNTGKRVTNRYFMSQVIAKLRNKGVIISSSAKGYKLPINDGDLYEFINHNSAMIKPMLERIRICRDSIRAATGNALDILDKPEFEYIKKT